MAQTVKTEVVVKDESFFSLGADKSFHEPSVIFPLPWKQLTINTERLSTPIDQFEEKTFVYGTVESHVGPEHDECKPYEPNKPLGNRHEMVVRMLNPKKFFDKNSSEKFKDCPVHVKFFGGGFVSPK